MKAALCNEMFEGWKLPDVFKCAAEVGYRGVEIAPFTLAQSVDQVSSKERAQLRKSAETNNIEIVGLHWLLVSPEGMYINHPDRKIWGRTRDYLIKLIEFCGDLGGTLMVFGSPKQRNLSGGLTYEEAWQLTRESFESCLPFCEKRDVTLCIEPLSKDQTDFVATAHDAARMVEEINHPKFRLILDVRSASDDEKPIPQLIRDVAPHLAHFHSNDDNGKGPGFGKADYTGIASALEEVGYRGYLSVEVFDFKPDPVTIAEESLANLSKYFDLE